MQTWKRGGFGLGWRRWGETRGSEDSCPALGAALGAVCRGGRDPRALPAGERRAEAVMVAGRQVPLWRWVPGGVLRFCHRIVSRGGSGRTSGFWAGVHAGGSL